MVKRNDKGKDAQVYDPVDGLEVERVGSWAITDKHELLRRYVAISSGARPERMAAYFKSHPAPPANAWLGVSVENKRQGLPRIPLLRQVPAAVRFLSIEPLLEDLGEFDLSGIDWVIVGGESGHRARRMHVAWARKIRLLCEAAEVPYFFKQWGAFNAAGVKVGKHAAGRVLDGRTYNEMPAN
jgi:protein gp37